MRFHRVVAGVILAAAALPGWCRAIDKPTGNPLVMSEIETEQPVPLAYLSPDGTTAACSRIRLHWSPAPSTSADDAATLTLDIPPDQAGAATFTAQFWNASLAGSLAWQKPWQGAHWKIFETPATDGTGIDAGLAVGMIATSARRPYPKDTLVIGNLHPDSSLGQVARLTARLDAAAHAGITRVIIPALEQFETDDAGHVVNVVSYAEELGLKCIPVENIVEATEVVMTDPPTGSDTPKYGPDIAGYIDGYAQREQAEAASELIYAPKEAQLGQYPARQAAAWKQVYAEIRQGQEAYKGGKVYVAYRLLARANSRMHGLDAITQDQLSAFDVKGALDTSEQLQTQLHYLMTPPPIDRAELQSALLISEMADWAYDIQALLEGSELVTKQTFSQRSDATQAERDRAREAILSANEEARYLLEGSSFYTGLLSHLGDVNPMPANTNAMNLLPQLIPAQLATAQIFADGIRPQANELRVGLLFDPRLAAYVNVLREETTQWNDRQRRRLNAQALNPAPANTVANVTVGSAATATTNDATATNSAPENVTSLVATNNAPVGFDPGTAYAPPHTEVEVSGGSEPQKKLSDVAQCLIWVNTDCEIAALDQKYLRLGGTVDPNTREWHLKDRSQLDALLQTAQNGALQGAAFAQEAQVNPALFGMIYERATYLRLHGDDANGLAGLRQYWRCALLGNMCWQLAHTHKAAAVDLGTNDDKKGKDKDKKTGNDGKTGEESASSTNGPTAAATNAAPTAPEETNTVETPVAPATNAAPENPPPRALPIVSAEISNAVKAEPAAPGPPDITNVPTVPPLEEPAAADTNVPPVAPVAEVVTNAPPLAVSTDTNAAPAATVDPAYPRALPVDLSTNAAPASAPMPTTDTNQAAVVIPVAKPATEDEYTGGDAIPAAHKALPVDVPSTNTPSAIQ
jgi:hypothetical protein